MNHFCDLPQDVEGPVGMKAPALKHPGESSLIHSAVVRLGSLSAALPIQGVWSCEEAPAPSWDSAMCSRAWMLPGRQV